MMPATRLFQISYSPCSLENVFNGIKSIHIVPRFADSCTPLYAEFLPHVASDSFVEVNLTIRLSHRNDLADMTL